MGARIHANVADIVRTRKGLARKLARAGRKDDLLHEIGLYLVESSQNRFEDQIGPDGKEWKVSGRVAASGGQTLVKDGHLRASITYRLRGGSVEAGSNLIYAGVHQKGATIRAKTAKGLIFQVPGKPGDNDVSYRRVQSVTIPARPYMGINAADRREIREIVEDHLREALE